jgi:hypothetical protein
MTASPTAPPTPPSRPDKRWAVFGLVSGVAALGFMAHAHVSESPESAEWALVMTGLAFVGATGVLRRRHRWMMFAAIAVVIAARIAWLLVTDEVLGTWEIVGTPAALLVGSLLLLIPFGPPERR